MASERTTQTQTVQQAATNSDGEAPWADLEVAIPSDRNHASLVALVECVLVELTHEQVGPSSSPSRCGDETYAVRRRRRRRRAVSEAALRQPAWLARDYVPRETVRDELITKVTRSAVSPPERTREAAASEPNTFTVKPVRELQTP